MLKLVSAIVGVAMFATAASAYNDMDKNIAILMVYMNRCDGNAVSDQNLDHIIAYAMRRGDHVAKAQDDFESKNANLTDAVWQIWCAKMKPLAANFGRAGTPQ
jgi:hypothetical protein